MTKKSVQLKFPTLREWQEYRTWINQPPIAKLLDRQKKVTLQEHNRYYQKLKKDKSQLYFGVYAGEEKKFIGICALKKIDRRQKKAELYICLGGTGVKGKGWGVISVKKLLEHACEKMKLNRICLYTPSFNKAAIGCYKKAGFKKEGEFVDDVFWKGRFYNSIRMFYLKKFWKGEKKKS